MCNPALEELTGRPESEMLRRFTLDRFFSEPNLTAFNQALASEAHGGAGRLDLYETALVDARGAQVPVRASARVLGDKGLVCFFRDLRKLRRLEREMADQSQILHQDKMMSLGRLAASVAHEINNPLSGILNYARLMTGILQRGGLTPEKTGKIPGVSRTGGKRNQPLLQDRLQPADLFPQIPAGFRPGRRGRTAATLRRAQPSQNKTAGHRTENARR